MSEQGKQIDNDLLTTDAIPSPPRDEIKRNEDNVQSDDQKTYKNSRPRSAGHKTSSKSKPMGFSRATKQSPTACATVINISGSNGIHFGPNIHMYINNKPEANKKQEDGKHNKEYVVTDEINKLLTSSTHVDKNHIFKIAPHFNAQWRDVARSLKYSEGEISQFEIDHERSGIKEVIIQFLLDWHRNDDEPTVGKLSKALWESNHQDVVQIWSKSFNK